MEVSNKLSIEKMLVSIMLTYVQTITQYSNLLVLSLVDGINNSLTFETSQFPFVTQIVATMSTKLEMYGNGFIL